MTAVLVKHIMSSPVVTFFAEQTLPLAHEVMKHKHLRHLPVIDDRGELVGLVTHRDLLRARSEPAYDELRIVDVMTRDIWTVTSDTLASVAGETLLEHAYGCLPVIDHTRKLVGIITERDYLRCAVHALRMNDPTVHMRVVTSAMKLAS